MNAPTLSAHYPVEHPSAGPHAGTTVVLLHGGNVANWMWDPQVEALADHHVLTPHLPGFGARAGEGWVSLAQTADDLAATIAGRARGGRAHVVGLSLGGIVATRLLARHPEVVSSALITGVPLGGVHGLARQLARLQVTLWDRRWFWRAQARAFRLPADSRALFVDHGMSITRENADRMLSEVFAGGVPDGLPAYHGRLLAIAGEKESSSVRRSFPQLRRALPNAEVRIAPGMHHAWSVEDPELFNDVVRAWVVHGTVDGRLQPV